MINKIPRKIIIPNFACLTARQVQSGIILIWICVFSFLIVSLGFGDEGRSPFKDWFPIIIKEEPIEEVIVKPEKVFDVSGYSLQGIVWGSYKPKAVINNKIYSIGDILDEAEIIKIDKEGVVLKLEDKEYVIARKNLSLAENTKAADDENKDKTGGNK